MAFRGLARRNRKLDGGGDRAGRPSRARRLALSRGLRWGALALLLPLRLPPSAVLAADGGSACSYVPAASSRHLAREGEVNSFTDCGTERSDGTAELRPEHLAALDFDADGLALVRFGEHFYYVRPDGRSARVPTYDNWADDFSEGLVRTLRTVDGERKVGYLDLELAVAVAPSFDWGFPFEGGRARVCVGCRAGEPDGDGHSEISGGLWGYIDRTGRTVVPIKYSREALQKLDERP